MVLINVLTYLALISPAFASLLWLMARLTDPGQKPRRSTAQDFIH